VHDKDTDKAAAAMDVNVGSLFDNDVEGCAHFCEHMLFLGTEAFPDEQSYSKYLNVCSCLHEIRSIGPRQSIIQTPRRTHVVIPHKNKPKHTAKRGALQRIH
jgi:predicted Zn-dependent peptidase